MGESAGVPPASGWAPGSRGVEATSTLGAVVAALNGSAADGPVTDWAVDAAARRGAPLRLVTIVDTDPQRTPSGALNRAGGDEVSSLDPGRRILDRAIERARSRRDVTDITAAVSSGSPASVLVRLSESAARVVVGAPSRGRLGRILLGSVAFPVATGACCPVVVVPAQTVVTSPRRIVVGVDGSETSLRAVEEALGIAKEARGARVTCVLGWNLAGVGGSVITEPSTESWTAVERRLAVLGHQKVGPVASRYPGIRVDIVTRYGSPARAVVEAAAELDVDLVIVGSRGLGGLRGLVLGSVSRQVVERAQTVVIVVH